MKMWGVVANSGMRALGLAPMNKELDDTVTVFLLAPHWLGGGRDGGPSYKVRTGLSDHNPGWTTT